MRVKFKGRVNFEGRLNWRDYGILDQSDLSNNLVLFKWNLGYLVEYFSLISNLSNTKLAERSDWTIGMCKTT